MWVDKRFVQREKSTGGKGRERTVSGKTASYGLPIDSAEDIIFSTEPDVLDNSQVFGGADSWYGLGVGWVMGRD